MTTFRSRRKDEELGNPDRAAQVELEVQHLVRGVSRKPE